MSGKDFYTTVECAIYLGRSESWVRNMLRSSRDFPRRKIGNRWIIPKKELEHWIDSTDFKMGVYQG